MHTRGAAEKEADRWVPAIAQPCPERGEERKGCRARVKQLQEDNLKALEQRLSPSGHLSPVCFVALLECKHPPVSWTTLKGAMHWGILGGGGVCVCVCVWGGGGGGRGGCGGSGGGGWGWGLFVCLFVFACLFVCLFLSLCLSHLSVSVSLFL